MTDALDYPVEPIDGVEPVFVRAMIIQSMAALYQQAVPDLTPEEASAAAIATWETDWPDDPAPRTMFSAREAVSGDLQYWGED